MPTEDGREGAVLVARGAGPVTQPVLYGPRLALASPDGRSPSGPSGPSEPQHPGSPASRHPPDWTATPPESQRRTAVRASPRKVYRAGEGNPSRVEVSHEPSNASEMGTTYVRTILYELTCEASWLRNLSELRLKAHFAQSSLTKSYVYGEYKITIRVAQTRGNI